MTPLYDAAKETFILQGCYAE